MTDQKPVALITGAARGIGAATTSRLIAQGWNVVGFDGGDGEPSLPYALASASDLEAAFAPFGDAAAAVVGDVRSAEDLDRAVERALADFGRLDAVVAAAGVIAGGQPLWEMDDAAWDAQLAINLGGVRNTVRAAAPTLVEQGSGRIVAIASAAGLKGNEKLAAYNASKAAVIGLIRGLAADLRGTGVTANSVCPGSTRTAMLEASAAIYDLESVEEFAVHHLTGQILDPGEVAAAIAFLCSDAASGITGVALPVDAGMTT